MQGPAFKLGATLGVALTTVGAPLAASDEVHPSVLVSVAQAASGPATGTTANTAPAANPFSIFTPTRNPIRHRIDYEFWDFALKNLVISMGPSTRDTARPPGDVLGSRIRQGHNSRYRLEGAMVGFSFMDEQAISGLAEYRRDLESVADTLDIGSLPRNEQLAYWLNLHNVALMEQIALNWPVRQPRSIEIDGVTLDEARFIAVRGIDMSLRDIRERIVFAHWRNPKVIYGFWRGEIGGPALERDAFTGDNVSSLLDQAAEDFVNSLRGTQKNGRNLDISTLYGDTAPFYFPNFDADIREHIAEYANEEVTDILGRTSVIRASIREWDIADLSGGSRGANYLAASRPGLSIGAAQLLAQRQRKFQILELRGDTRRGQVFFSNIRLPGDPPNANAVE
ncbi:DUF547 domain-containing protein [Erythrobacter sp. Alg231-14]|uniref:DUF547 domain-containing protein n=1 Tax=Erythrobacter sp. Alg231-14 TaxID=1922225 RepID=UPI000D55546B